MRDIQRSPVANGVDWTAPVQSRLDDSHPAPANGHDTGVTNLDVASAARVLGMFFGVAMPFFNIPLIRRIVKRRSSEDISLTWVIGV